MGDYVEWLRVVVLRCRVVQGHIARLIVDLGTTITECVHVHLEKLVPLNFDFLPHISDLVLKVSYVVFLLLEDLAHDVGISVQV